jgi:hypothetical protein
MPAVIRFYPQVKTDEKGALSNEQPKDITVNDVKFEAQDTFGLVGFVKFLGKQSGSSKERTYIRRLGDIKEIEYV